MARTAGRFNAVRTEFVPAAQEVQKTYHTALYARFSVDMNGSDKADGSIESQLQIMRDYAGQHPEFGICQEYVDKGYSGTNFDRPEFQRMMEDVRDGRINLILIKDLSRLGRDYLETGNYIESIFPFLGVRLISINDHFDTDDTMNENKALEIALKNLVNDMYARDVSKRIVTLRKNEMERGKFTGSNAPYGYKVDEDDPLRHYVVDECAAEVVRKIFAMADGGMSLRKIADTLGKEGYAIPGQYLKTGHLLVAEGEERKNWHIGSISNILKNQAYIGNLVQGKRRKRLCDNEKQHFTDKEEWIIEENAHEPIISKELFERIRAKMEKKVSESPFSSERGKDVPVKDYKYRDILYCGVCGKRLQQCSKLFEKAGRLYRQYFFNCPTQYGIPGRKGCYVGISEKKMDEILYHCLAEEVLISIPDGKRLLRETKKLFYKSQEDSVKKIADIEKKITIQEYEGSRYYEQYVTGTISREELLGKQKLLADKTAKLKAQIDLVQEKMDAREKLFKEKQRWLRSLLRLKEMDESEIDRDIITALVKRIDVYPDKNMEITYTFDGAFQSSADKEDKPES